MKTKTFLMAIAMLVTSTAVNAQAYRNSRYYNYSSDRLKYPHGSFQRTGSRYGGLSPYTYFGLNIGPTFSTVVSDSPIQRAGDVRTGVNVGINMGVAMSRYSPVFFETGLNYTQKGGKKAGVYQYNLDYLSLPLTVKYIYSPSRDVSIQPFAGGYLACGVNGKAKDYEERHITSLFGNGKESLQRFDGGLRVGCGVGFNVLYAEVAYEYGLSDISKNNFDSTHNSTVMLNFGVKF